MTSQRPTSLVRLVPRCPVDEPESDDYSRHQSLAGQGVLLRTKFFRLDWTLRFTHTSITLDDHVFELPWGEHYLPLESGRHQLQVSYPYLWASSAGEASALVDVPPNRVVHACYTTPKSVIVSFLPGNLTIRPRAEA